LRQLSLVLEYDNRILVCKYWNNNDHYGASGSELGNTSVYSSIYVTRRSPETPRDVWHGPYRGSKGLLVLRSVGHDVGPDIGYTTWSRERY
jgi:hypothetical protein